MNYNVNVNSLPIKKVVRLQLTGLREFRFRLWLAKQIFRFGAWIARVSIDFQ